jgi:hypothetical protein
MSHLNDPSFECRLNLSLVMNRATHAHPSATWPRTQRCRGAGLYRRSNLNLKHDSRWRFLWEGKPPILGHFPQTTYEMVRISPYFYPEKSANAHIYSLWIYVHWAVSRLLTSVSGFRVDDSTITYWVFENFWKHVSETYFPTSRCHRLSSRGRYTSNLDTCVP